MSASLASIIVPVFNAIRRIEELVELLAAQDCDFSWDLTFVDSGSCDGTVEWLTARARDLHVPLQVVELGSEGFDHGDARNYGAARSRGEVLVFLTDDARPRSTNWLATVVEAVQREDGGALYCRNVVPDGTPPWATLMAEGDAVYAAAEATRREEPATLADPSSLRAAALYCDTASAMLRSLWERHPYPRADAGEDMLLARALREAGVEVQHLDDASVEHVHAYSNDQLRRRALLDGRFNLEAFGREITPSASECNASELAERMAETCANGLVRWSLGPDETEEQRGILRERFEAFVEGAHAGMALAAGRRWPTSVLDDAVVTLALVHDDSQREEVEALSAALSAAGIEARAISSAELEDEASTPQIVHVLAPLSREELRESGALRRRACITRGASGWRMHLFGFQPAPHGAHDRYELRLAAVPGPLDEDPPLAAARWAFRYRQLVCMARAREALTLWGREASSRAGEVRREGEMQLTLGPDPAEVAFDLPPLGDDVDELELIVDFAPEDSGTTRCLIAKIDGLEQALVGTLCVEADQGHAVSRTKLRLPAHGGRLTLTNLTPSGSRTICRLRSVRLLRSGSDSKPSTLFVEPSLPTAIVSPPKVAVVIVTLSGVPRLRGCLAALAKSNYPSDRLETLVVDNGASWETRKWLRSEHPTVKRITTHRNVGFTKAANLGACKADEAQVLVFLNDDAEVAEDFLEELVLPVGAGRCAASAARMMLPGGEPEYIGGAGNFQGLAFGAPQDGALAEQLDRPRKTLFACGGAMAIDAGVFRDTGGFDTDFFAYYDDIDLGWRLWLLGHEVHYVPSAACTHARSSTSSCFPPEAIRLLQVRNAMLTCIKNLGDDALRATLPSLLALGSRRLWIQAKRPELSPLRIEGFGLKGRLLRKPLRWRWRRPFKIERMAMADLVGMQDLLGNWSHWMSKRADVQSSRTRLDCEVLPLFLDPLRCVEGEAEYMALQSSLIEFYGLTDVFPSHDEG